MRAVTVAAGAALIGSAVASSHVKNMHQKLHARSEWGDWSSESADPTTSSSKPDWTTPAVDTKTSVYDWTTPVVDTKTSTSKYDWTTPVVDTKTSTSKYDWPTSSSTPAVWTSKDPSSTFSNNWGDWESSTTTTSDWVDPTTSSTVSWEDWSSTSADPTTSWADWSSSTPVVATSATTTWADWSSAVTDPATSTETWGDWSTDGSVVVTTIHSTTTTTIWLGVASASTASASSWADWSASSSTPVVATSSLPSGWNGAPWPTTDACVKQIVTSYGAPTWYPTPSTVTVTVTPVATSTASSSWDDWSSTSSTPVVASSSSSTWADWSSTPAAVTSTTTAGWGSASSSSSASWGAASSWPSSSSSSSGSGSLHSNGNYFGMTYSPYTSQGGCKDAGTVSSDIAKIASKGFTTVRVYSTDCNTLENVGNAAKESGLKIILGVFISSTGISGAQEQVTAITSWAQWDLVELIVVGNEAVFNGYCSASELAGFISSCKWSFQSAGYTGSVTTTEPLDTWQSQGTTFCGVVDVVSANLYAFFNAQTTADKAGDLIQSQIEILNGICPGKDSYVMESGWPTAGNCNGVACPSPENQATALKGIQAVSGSKIVFFSFEDEAWKAPGEFNVEQHWGCADVF